MSQDDSLEAVINGRLARIAEREAELRALVAESDRRARLMGEIARVPGAGPLRGLFLGVKDILHADGLPTLAGTGLPPRLFDTRPGAAGDADCVAALRRAGCLVLGKTVTTEFAYFEPGPTTNPHDPRHTPGGSSSGSAAAVAAGYCELALGTQTVGSVIRPAAFCGVVGYKPSYGAVSTDGLLLCAPSVDTIGLFAPDVATVVRGAAVVVQGWKPGRSGSPVLGIPEGRYLEQATPEGLAALRAQVERLEERGYRCVSVDALADVDDVNGRHADLQAAEMAQQHAAWMDAHFETYRPRTQEILRRGRGVSPARLSKARDSRQALRRRLERQMTAAGIDLWICPAAPGPAPRGLRATGDPAMNLPWTHAGLPAVSLPAGWVGGLPLGLQVVARFGADGDLLAAAADLEGALRAS